MSDTASELLAAETGARRPQGPTRHVIVAVAIAWSVFQLWYASPLPFLTASIVPVLNDTQARSIHLAFAIFLAFLSYPAWRGAAQDCVPLLDWGVALAGAGAAGYLFLFYRELAERPGLPTTEDLVVSGIGLVLLLEATRRSLGPALTVLALVFLAYVFFGDAAPQVIAWKGASFERAMDHMWLSTEGVFGIALGVSTSFVFLFVLFGALLERAGGGNYFIEVAFSLLGHLRGGPAKAAVLASGLTGIISGSSIANTVTTGTFTIPLMRRVGFSAEKAGAVEVAASVNGQLMPPVMGAAAFLMVEYVGIPYVDVIRHALLPAIIAYGALLYVVHLEALKAGMQPTHARAAPAGAKARLIRWGLTLSGFLVLAGVLYWGLWGIRAVFGASSGWVLIAVAGLVYVALLAYKARFPDLEKDGVSEALGHLPPTWQVVRTGLHFVLPIAVLIWCLILERLSPGLSAFWACLAMGLVTLTQRPLVALFRGDGGVGAGVAHGARELVDGLEIGARNMVPIGVATAAAGIIVGAVSLTGVGQMMSELVELLSGGHLIVMLILVAFLSLILGMGLPTTANYIVVASLLAGVVVDLGSQNGLVVPLIAVHMFVFYFGIMADVTPPVGLASFAAAAISGGDPIRTGLQAFRYSLRIVILPFLFLFNTKLLLIGVGAPLDLVLTVGGAALGMLVFCAATEGYFFVRSRLWEGAVLLLVAFTLFRPGFWIDLAVPPYERVSFEEAQAIIPQKPADAKLRLVASGMTLEGDQVTRTVLLPLGPGESAGARLAASGLTLETQGNATSVAAVGFGSTAEKLGLEWGFEITSIELPTDRPSPYISYIPALALLGGVAWLQRRRLSAGA